MNRYKYVAFISYSRVNFRDASKLRSRLHRFQFSIKVEPENLPPQNDKYIRRIALDKDVFNPDDNFMRQIKKSIDESRYLIVLCSPASAKSPIVEQEIEYFLETRGAEAHRYLIPIIVAGAPDVGGENECLPPPLRGKKWEEYLRKNNLSDVQPLRLKNLPTLRPEAGETARHAWDCAVVLTAAYILRVDRDKLYDEFQSMLRRTIRRRAAAAFCLSFVFLCLSVWAIFNWNRAHLARLAESRTLAQSDFYEASRLIEQEEDVPGALAQMSGALADGLCWPAAERLYGLLLQRSWIVDRGALTDEETEYCRQKSETDGPTTIGSTRWKFDARRGEKIEGSSDQFCWSCRVVDSQTDAEPIDFELVSISAPLAFFAPNDAHFYALYEKEPGDFFLERRSTKDADAPVNRRNFAEMLPLNYYFSPEGLRFVLELASNSTKKENEIWILNGLNLETELTIPCGDSLTNVCAFSSDGRRFAVGQPGDRLRVYDVWNARLAAEAKATAETFGYFAFSADNRYLFALGEDGVSAKFEIQASTVSPRSIPCADGEIVAKRVGVPGTQTILQISSSGKDRLSVDSCDFSTGTRTVAKPIKVDVGEGPAFCDWFGAFGALNVAVGPSERTGGAERFVALTAKVGDKTRLLIFDVKTEEIGDFDKWKLAFSDVVDEGDNSWILRVSPDGRFFVLGEAGDVDGNAFYIYDRRDKKRVVDATFSDSVVDAAFNSDGTTLAVVGIGGTEIWDRNADGWKKRDFSKAPAELRKALENPGQKVKFSSKNALGVAYKQSLVAFDSATGEILFSKGDWNLKSGSGAFDFSPDGTKIAYLANSKNVQVFELDSGRPVTPKLRCEYDFQDVRLIDVDGRLTLIGVASQTDVNARAAYHENAVVEIWDVETKRPIGDMIALDEKLSFLRLQDRDLYYGTAKILTKAPIFAVREPQTAKERAVLQELLPLICLKYGGGRLNERRAPELVANPERPLAEFCRTLSEEQKAYPAVKPWLELESWLAEPLETRTVAPDSDEKLTELSTRLAKSAPEDCLNINPADVEAYCRWIDEKENEIARNDYIFGSGGVKKFGDERLKRETEYNNKIVVGVNFSLTNPRVAYFLDRSTRDAYETFSNSLEAANARLNALKRLGRDEEAEEPRKKILESIK